VQFWDEGNALKLCLLVIELVGISSADTFRNTKLKRLQKGRADVNNNASMECEDDADSSIDSAPVHPLSKIPRLTRRALRPSSSYDSLLCFFCGILWNDLRQVITFTVDERVRSGAAVTNHTC
jgi:hypothetical protein